MNDVPVPHEEHPAAIPKTRAVRRLEAMQTRAERLRWRTVARPKPDRAIRLWVPVTPILLLLSPLILLVLGVAVLLPKPFGMHPATMILGVGRFLASLNGTQVDVERERRSIQIRLF
ncbi:hypothetical protein [Phenylobacterium aquaticum]|uniref:hypothetical protein n=1 Tax=Phenylobacterium aquaticum TaxID=1763816 RepID=UPI001F5DF645|nr:hypothetical protein [Phenylobacterium aquaticum]MCI3131905.1 hypothetical protein [Phenylobacterium aquaticum]